ncbi:hypothetical protein AGMMS49545_15810 [Betaproteobacteria bacterium]|nr:hypothetical protein AGMMS49545_15810 [Betaproteobacteria bacterium]GHU43300.1 hypothetical protein AGMMS50289_09470 [Betaproteobacteria bacterium]
MPATQKTAKLSCPPKTAREAKLKKQRETEWLEQNQCAIEAYRRYVDKHGLLSDTYRTFARED